MLILIEYEIRIQTYTERTPREDIGRRRQPSASQGEMPQKKATPKTV